MEPRKNKLLWLDIETTGLVKENQDIIEIGMIATDDEGNWGERMSWFIYSNKPAIMWDTTARHIHQESGLIDLVENFGSSLQATEEDILSWLETYQLDNCTMAGAGVGEFDRPFLKFHLPVVEAKFHYRNLEMRTLTRFFGLSKTSDNHRAIDDLCRDIEAYRRCRGILALARHNAGV